ncbi:MAG TPA: AMP-binding protein, partial [Nevskia sp.]|nr:AMP-binding protein [Nevskia sp.]
LVKLIREEQVTFSHCVPTLLHMLLTHPASQGADLSRLKMIIGGAALPKGLARLALERGIDVFAGYGMSETGPLQIVNHLTSAELAGADLDAQAALRSRTGRAVALCDVYTVDESGQPLPRDGKSVGEIVYRSPWLTQGYLKEDQRSEELWRGGHLHSGDLGTFNGGVLQVADRVKDVIKTGGEWIASLEIEDLISQVPGVSEVAVIGVPDEKWGERPLALVVPRPGQSVDAGAVRRHLAGYAEKGTISKYGVPDKVLLVESLEKTSVGKLDKKLLRKKYAAG